jgi:hypothetical protein
MYAGRQTPFFETAQMNIRYQHTQTGYVIIWAIIGGCLFFGAVLPAPVASAGTGLMIGILLVVGILFATLTIIVTDEFVLLKFGPGLVRKKFILKDIASCKAERRRLWSWGIHGWGKKWLYNVSGFDGVDLTMKSGAWNRIGTDDPQGLEQAINSALSLIPR